MMTFIENYWVIIPLVALVFILIKEYLRLPSEKQMQQVRKWMLWTVAQAEIKLGSGTGKLKLSMVYGMFVDRFPWLAKVISFEKFSELTDKSLEELNGLISENKNAKDLISQ